MLTGRWPGRCGVGRGGGPARHQAVTHAVPVSNRGADASCSSSSSTSRPGQTWQHGGSCGATLADVGTRLALERLFRLSTSSQDDLLPRIWFIVDEKPTQKQRNSQRTPEFFANVGDAIRTLREDVPDLFVRDLNYEIYREDIVFKDPRNTFVGMKNYKTIFWSLRFHGKIFFSRLYVDVKRIWQPEDGVIKMRWTVHGIPRVPWEAEGTFDGVSTYKLDNAGRVCEHSVDNMLLRDPPFAVNQPLLAGLNLVPMTPEPLCPGGMGMSACQADAHAAATTASAAPLPASACPAPAPSSTAPHQSAPFSSAWPSSWACLYAAVAATVELSRMEAAAGQAAQAGAVAAAGGQGHQQAPPQLAGAAAGN